MKGKARIFADVTWPNSTNSSTNSSRSLEDFLFISAAPTRQSPRRSPAVFGFFGVGGARKASQRQDLNRDYVMKSSEQLGMEIGGVQLIGWRECVPQMGIWVNDEHFFKGKRRKTNWLAWRKMLVSRSADFDMAKWWKMSPWNLIIWSVFCPRSRWSRWSRYQELIHQHDDSIFTIHCHIFPLPGGTQKHRNSISALQLEVSIWDAEVLRPRGCSLERNLPWRTLNLGGFERFSESK